MKTLKRHSRVISVCFHHFLLENRTWNSLICLAWRQFQEPAWQKKMKPSIKGRRRKWLQSRPAGLPSFVYLNRQGGSGAWGPGEAHPQVMSDNAAFSGIALLTTALFHLIWHSRYLISASESLLENENLNRRQWRQEHSVVMPVFIYENSLHWKELLKTILSSFGNCLSLLWLVYDLWRIVGHGIIKTFDMKRLTIQRSNKWARKWSHGISKVKRLSHFYEISLK